jgi:hypothetical protein
MRGGRAKVIAIMAAAAGALLLNSCWNENTPVSPSIGVLDEADWLQMRDEAQSAMAKACEEFYAGIPSNHDNKLTPKDIAEDAMDLPDAPTDSIAWDLAVIDTVDEPAPELEPNQYGLQEKIKALAFEAYNTNNTTALEQFLRTNGLYDKYQKICKKYNLEYHAKNLSMRPKEKKLTDDQLFDGGWEAGDVLGCYTNSSSGSVGLLGWLVPGKWKHAGFWDKNMRNLGDRWCILSASSKVKEMGGVGNGSSGSNSGSSSGGSSNGSSGSSGSSGNSGSSGSSGGTGCVGYESTTQWANETEYTIERVSGTSKGQAAINYSKLFLKTEFSFFTGRRDDDQFYCSKTVYRGWLSQGRDIEYQGDWGRKLVFWRWSCALKFRGKCRVSYPEFKWVPDPDIWVTPTDLIISSQTYYVGGDK